jgi:replicative DNA helicase
VKIDDLIDRESEARLLISCIQEPDVLAALDELETLDFFDYRHQAAWNELRNLQCLKEPISINAIDLRLRRFDAMKDTHVADKAGVEYLVGLFTQWEPYEAELDAARADAKKLRMLRGQRDAGEAVSLITGDDDAARSVVAGDNAFLTMPARVRGEFERRQALANRAIPYHQTFLDDCLRAILPHDLILIGAESGLGKTDLALSIAMGNAMSDRNVAYFALEAEPDEMEMRVKYSWLARETHRRGHFYRNELNFPDWLLCKCEHIVGELNAECERWFHNHLGGFWTFYRNQKRFDAHELEKRIREIHKFVDLIVVDHLHYVDVNEDESENRAVGELMKTIRDVTIAIGKPVILVAHLRKKNENLKKIVPDKDDFHGSSNIMKICTQAITIAPARKVKPGKYYHAPTYVRVVKDRRAGAPPFVALQNFDIRTRSYDDDYVIGRLKNNGTDWEPVKEGDQPPWARSHKQLVLEFV